MDRWCGGWDRDYEKLKKQALGDSTKDKWVPWINGDIGEKHVEISCVHTSEPHGLLSWGWDGEFKIVIFDQDYGSDGDRSLKKKSRVKIHERMMACATALAEELNKQCPKGI